MYNLLLPLKFPDKYEVRLPFAGFNIQNYIDLSITYFIASIRYILDRYAQSVGDNTFVILKLWNFDEERQRKIE